MRKGFLFASVSLRPLLGLGNKPPVEEVTYTRAGDVAYAAEMRDLVDANDAPEPPTRRQQMDELVRISNRQIVLRHLHPRYQREAYGE